MKLKKDSVQVVNTLTGEVYDFEWESIDKLRLAYQEIQSMMKAFDRAAKKMNVALTEFLGDEDEYIFPDGAKLKRYFVSRVELRKEDVAKYLDADQLDLVLHVSTSEVKEMFAEMVDKGELPKGAFSDIESTAYKKPASPYIRIIK
jgi:hypothetical protein